MLLVFLYVLFFLGMASLIAFLILLLSYYALLFRHLRKQHPSYYQKIGSPIAGLGGFNRSDPALDALYKQLGAGQRLIFKLALPENLPNDETCTKFKRMLRSRNKQLIIYWPLLTAIYSMIIVTLLMWYQISHHIE